MKAALSHSEQLNAAATTLTLAWTSDAIWWFYRGKDTFPIYEPAHDRFVDFFRFDERAHLNNCVVHLCSLFDSRSDTVNLRNLAEGSAMDSSSKCRLLGAIQSVAPSLAKVTLLRSNLVAHRSSAESYDVWFAKAALRHDDMSALLKVAEETLNKMRAAAGLDEWMPNDGTLEDVKSLLEALARYD